MATCIYPGPHGAMSPEHYLPAALGTFEGYEPLQDRVCRACNHYIGNQTETQFLRAGPIAFFRWVLGIEGRGGLPPSPFYRRAAGAPPLVAMGRVPGFEFDILLEVEPGTENVYPLRQIMFDGGLAGIHPIPVLDRMRGNPESLWQHLDERGLRNATPIHAFAAEDEIPWVSDLVRAVGGQPPGVWVTSHFTPQPIQVVVTVRVTEAHFRAVAKIAFHYTLKMFPDVTGLEPEFAPIRDFIWNGGDADRFVRQRADQFVENFRRGQRPTHWMHILAVVRTHERVTAYGQFFAGPRSLPPPYEVMIGRDPSRIVRPTERRAHQFVILDPAVTAGVAGRMEDAQPAHLVWKP
ncbi:MAG: hypothetical protein ACE5JS_17125 [Nitrospinota bacterium]